MDTDCLAGLTQSGVLVVAGVGVFQLAGSPPPPHLDIKVAWLQADPGTPAWQRLSHRSGVISHGSACLLHGLGDLPTGTVEMFAAARGACDAAVRVHHEPRPGRAEVMIADGLPVTTPARTIVDLLRAGVDGGHVGGVVADAARCGLVDLQALALQVGEFAPAYGLARSASGQDLVSNLLASAGE